MYEKTSYQALLIFVWAKKKLNFVVVVAWLLCPPLPFHIFYTNCKWYKQECCVHVFRVYDDDDDDECEHIKNCL